MGVTAKDELELGGGHEFTDDVDDIISHDAFSGGEVADTHLDDPALGIGDLITLPLLNVGLHLDVLWLPVIRLHRLVEIVSPLILERENVEEHGLAAIDDFLRVESGLGFFLIEDKRAVSQGNCGGLRHDSFSEGLRGGLADLIAHISEAQRS